MALKFDGVLSKHREHRQIGLFETEDQVSKKMERWYEEDCRNLDLLCAHFEIADAPGKYMLLAIRLAEELVPCFSAKAKEGRPRKWDEHTSGVLAVELERITALGETIDTAAATLAAKEPWRSFLQSWDQSASSFGADPTEAIKTAYKTANKMKWTDVVRDAFKYHEATGTIHEWESEIVSNIRRK